MKHENFETYINLITTTVLGVAGTLTGNVGLQIAALCPAVIFQIFSDLGDKRLVDEEIEQDLKSLTKDVYDFLEKKVSQSDQKKLFHNSKTQVEISFNKKITLEEYIKDLYTRFTEKMNDQSATMLAKDTDDICSILVEGILASLPKYLRLQAILAGNTLLDHEKRIIKLEDNAANNLKVNSIVPTQICDDTQFYCDKFKEPLFLHRGLPTEQTICLKDVYVLPEAFEGIEKEWRRVEEKINQGTDDQNLDNSLLRNLKKFCDYVPRKPGDEMVNILFLEGQAAMGKSSLISYLCWIYENKRKEYQKVFGGKKLVTIRLREIPRSGTGILNIQSPLSQISAYLLEIQEKNLLCKHQWEKYVAPFFKDAILVLEGFDELCMMEEIVGDGKKRYFQNLYQEFQRMDCNCKVIVTTRPEYLKVNELDFPKVSLEICPFSALKREMWIEQYESICEIPLELKNILIEGENSVLNGIVESPLTLYMIVARNIQISEDSNLWYIYHQIFSEELYKRNYEKGSPHAINQYQALLYRLTAEIANAISQESHLSITVEKLLDIKDVRRLLEKIGVENGIQDILEDCFALACYFRISEKRNSNGKIISAIEFYHNNIKDYFYCEYLWLHLEDIYANIPSDLQQQEVWFMGEFQNLFQYSTILQDNGEQCAKPLIFFKSKLKYLKENGITENYIREELSNHYFKHFFGKMLQTGFLQHYEYTGDENAVNMMRNIYTAVLKIYHSLYRSVLPKNERMELVEDTFIGDRNVVHNWRILFPSESVYDFTGIKFDGLDFDGIDFKRGKFCNSSFRGCVFSRTVFRDCDLRSADFCGTNFKEADLSGAFLDETTTFSYDTKFEYTRINSAHYRYFRQWVYIKSISFRERGVMYMGTGSKQKLRYKIKELFS